MEMEAVVEERASLETQLASLRTQIDSLTSEVEEQKSKVETCIFLDESKIFLEQKKKKYKETADWPPAQQQQGYLQLNTNEDQINTKKQQGWPPANSSKETSS